MALLPFVNLWEERSLVLHFSYMSTKAKYLGTYIGFVWAVIEPLFAFIILYVVFTSLRDFAKPDFGIYLLIGILFFQIYSRGTLNGLGCLRSNAGIIKSLNIRKELFPVAATGSTALLVIIKVAVLFAIMPFFDFIPSWTIILLPIPLVLLLLLILGLSYMLSIAYVYIKDIHSAWSIFSYGLFFVSPIFWYVDEMGGILLEIQKINPLGQLMEIAHKIVFNEIPPLNDLLFTTLYVLAILFTGYFLFQKFEKKIAEEL